MITRRKDTAPARVLIDAPSHSYFWKIYKFQMDENSFKSNSKEALQETIEKPKTAMFGPLSSIQVNEEFINCKV